MMSEYLVVGQRVLYVALEDPGFRHGSAQPPPAGAHGVIMYIAGPISLTGPVTSPYAVEFEDYFKGRDCNGFCLRGQGWWCAPEELELVEEAEPVEELELEELPLGLKDTCLLEYMERLVAPTMQRICTRMLALTRGKHDGLLVAELRKQWAAEDKAQVPCCEDCVMDIDSESCA